MKKLLEKKAIADFWKQDGDIWGMCPPEGPLYHYTSSVKTVENVLTTGELWLSKSTVMNDFSEIKYGCDLFIEVLRKEEIGNELTDLLIDKFLEVIKDKIFGDIFILCFSENGNSRLLWDSYSRKTGYNIEFSNEFIKDFISNAPFEKMVLRPESKGFVKEIYGRNIEIVVTKDEFYTGDFSYSTLANKVLYNREQQISIFKEALEVIREAYNDKNLLDINLCMSCILDFIPFFKDQTLKEEEEYRMVIKVHNKKESRGKRQYLRPIQHYREFNNKLFPYLILKMRNNIYVKSVCMGYCNSDEFSFETLQDFISTLSQDIKINRANYALRW